MAAEDVASADVTRQQGGDIDVTIDRRRAGTRWDPVSAAVRRALADSQLTKDLPSLPQLPALSEKAEGSTSSQDERVIRILAKPPEVPERQRAQRACAAAARAVTRACAQRSCLCILSEPWCRQGALWSVAARRSVSQRSPQLVASAAWHWLLFFTPTGSRM